MTRRSRATLAAYQRNSMLKPPLDRPFHWSPNKALQQCTCRCRDHVAEGRRQSPVPQPPPLHQMKAQEEYPDTVHPCATSMRVRIPILIGILYLLPNGAGDARGREVVTPPVRRASHWEVLLPSCRRQPKGVRVKTQRLIKEQHGRLPRGRHLVENGEQAYPSDQNSLGGARCCLRSL